MASADQRGKKQYRGNGQGGNWTICQLSGEPIKLGSVFEDRADIAQMPVIRTIMGMDAQIPTDLVSDREREIYTRGWRDRLAYQTSIAGRTKSTRKARAARRNGKMGGKPKGSRTYIQTVLEYARKHSGGTITSERSDLRQM